MNLETGKTVLFVILDQYADWEAAYVSAFIQEMGQGKYSVKTVSITKNGVQSIGGFTALPDYDIATAPDDYVGVVLIGGMSWRKESAQQVKPLVEKALEQKRIVAGICDATTFLGKMGALNHVRHTSNALYDLKQWAGSAYTGDEYYIKQQAVRDDTIITANGTAALEFAREVALALEVAPEDKIVGWYNYHKLGCYKAPMPKM